ncbi:putative membrane protein [Corynebacterium glutamicum MB001]|uniref:Glycosyltransferase n=3 Tax=Corynebacterium TaxID=1716 RepID=A0A0F6Z7Z5_9CORY|nr:MULTISPECIES: hypothetical protein [Corynebacterium]AGT06681.1 putative membrane protein [Corynebacterium glutamicum MB001]AIK86356.1 hypothetical protein CGLAR1_14305 [Corynebacterium glutamicum]AIK89140.1 hypothetical protein AR0_14450 [Corynebacterium glutamicum]AJE68593.1 hypothetical protein SB89_14305 [Corynebacterium glutamicum]AKF28785.1 hypothetical protein YH66_15260 [[Brevibacterium] flavum]
MSTTVLLVTMVSVFVGFLCFGGAFASFMYKKSNKQIWTLFSIAIVLITVIPVTIAVFWATTPA